MQITQESTTDWHCHLLPALDDGPSTIEESLGMASLLARSGYTQVYCTPHLIKGVYAAGNDAVRRAIVGMQAELDKREIGLKLLPGREYCLDEFLLEYLDDPLPLGDTSMILVEISRQAPVDQVKEILFRICQKGYTPLIAHPERCRLLEPPHKDTNQKGIFGSFFNSKLAVNSLLVYLQEIDCKFQGNLGSFAGFYGEQARLSAKRLREMGLYSCFGSDGHSGEGLEAVLNI